MMTHQPPTLELQRAFARFGFWSGPAHGRTDTMCDTNDHLFGCGLVGQQV